VRKNNNNNENHKSCNPVASSNCCKNNHNNDLAKITISILADSEKIVIFGFDFKIITAQLTAHSRLMVHS